jgi:DNA adenine methylase
MPERYGCYFEPFTGGGALFFRVAPKRAVLNDANPDLVWLYRMIAADPNLVVQHLRSHHRKHSKRHYYAMRARWNRDRDRWSTAKRAAAFVYLNKTCFNGLWRVNQAGEFNVPMGRYKNPAICVPDALADAQFALRNATIRQGDYLHAVADAKRGDFVYFDPPYDPVSATASFTAYATDAFGRDQQRHLAEHAARLVARGCQVMLSNSDTRFIRSLYTGREGFRIDRVMCPRAINSNAAKRAAVAEVIITGGYTPTHAKRRRA